MPRKPKVLEEEQEVEVKIPQKKKSAAARWFDEYAVDSKEDLRTICDLTARSLHDQFLIGIESNNIEVYGVAFYVIFMEILKFLRAKQKEKFHKQFSVEICNSINIGYTNNMDEDNEKVGNFMPMIEYIGINRNVVPADDSSSKQKSKDYMITWKQMNSHQNIEFYKMIEENAKQTLKEEYNMDIRTSELVMPILCIFLDNTVNLLKIKFQDLVGKDVSEVSINVFGLYTVFYSFDEDTNTEQIEYQPGIALKLATKQDELASI